MRFRACCSLLLSTDVYVQFVCLFHVHIHTLQFHPPAVRFTCLLLQVAHIVIDDQLLAQSLRLSADETERRVEFHLVEDVMRLSDQCIASGLFHAQRNLCSDVDVHTFPGMDRPFAVAQCNGLVLEFHEYDGITRTECKTSDDLFHVLKAKASTHRLIWLEDNNCIVSEYVRRALGGSVVSQQQYVEAKRQWKKQIDADPQRRLYVFVTKWCLR
jgi:hypothetical protein